MICTRLMSYLGISVDEISMTLQKLRVEWDSVWSMPMEDAGERRR